MLHMHVMNQQFYLLITHQDTHLNIRLTVLNLPGRADNAQLFHATKSANSQHNSLFLPTHVISVSPCPGFHLRQVILHATHSALYISKCNAFLLLSHDPLV